MHVSRCTESRTKGAAGRHREFIIMFPEILHKKHIVEVRVYTEVTERKYSSHTVSFCKLLRYF